MKIDTPTTMKRERKKNQCMFMRVRKKVSVDLTDNYKNVRGRQIIIDSQTL